MVGRMMDYYILKEAGSWKGTYKTKKEASAAKKLRIKFLKNRNNDNWKLLSIEKIKRKVGKLG